MQIISTDNAPEAIGPYSQAVLANGMVFCSGQIPLNTSGDVVGENIEEQTQQVLDNLAAVLEAAESGFNKVVKTTVYLADIKDFAEMNKVYEKAFGESKPARATVEVSNLPKGVLVEIDCIALQ